MALMPLKRLRRGARTEQGAVAIITSVALMGLLIVTAMVLDFGLVRLDRQTNKSAADDAVAAGMRGFDQGDGQVYPFRGACSALQFVKANVPDLSGLTWGSCTNANYTKVCDPSPTTGTPTWASYDSGWVNGYRVQIKSPYTLPDPKFPSDSVASLSADTGDRCKQIAVIIAQERKPGLGSLATDSDLTSTIRSVGRVKPGDGDLSPALILLEQTRCQVLTNGNSSPSNTSKIWVAGSGTTPASIHSDSDATDAGCGSGPNQQLLAGNKLNGVVAFGAPSGGLPGLISTYATSQGRAANIVSDGASNIFGTTAVLDPAYTGVNLPGTKSSIMPRTRVGRQLVDERYLPGVTTSVRAAYFQWLLNHSAPTGYTRYGCNPDMAVLGSLASTASVYIDCPGNSGITLDGKISAGRIYFHGFIKGGKVHMPNATEVYVDNTKDDGTRISSTAMTLGNGDRFCMRGASCTSYSTDTCNPGVTGTSVHGRLFVRRGMLSSSTGGLLRLCNTTVYMEGGQLGLGTAASPGGCLPTTFGTLPTATPCTGASDPAGNGYLQLAGATDWTAPNQYGVMTAAQKQPAWDDGEDLALWDETYAVSPNFKMAGGAELNVSGVFMVPNAFPMVFSGGAVFDLQDAQFITRSFAVDGGAQLLMKVDPENAISLPKLVDFTMVR